MPSASGEVEVPHAALATQPDAGVREALDRVDADDRASLFGERQRHAAAAASGVEHAATNRHAGALEKGNDLGAAVILEQRIVVFGPEPEVRVRLDGALVNRAHGPCRRAPEFVDERRAVVTARRLRHVECHDDAALAGRRPERPG